MSAQLNTNNKKYCVICGEQVPDNQIICSKGHSRFKLTNEGYFFSARESQRIRDILISSGYTIEEIREVNSEITRIINATNTRVDDSLIDSIKNQIIQWRQEKLEKQREAERRTQEIKRIRDILISSGYTIEEIREANGEIIRLINVTNIRVDDSLIGGIKNQIIQRRQEKLEMQREVKKLAILRQQEIERTRLQNFVGSDLFQDFDSNHYDFEQNLFEYLSLSNYRKAFPANSENHSANQLVIRSNREFWHQLLNTHSITVKSIRLEVFQVTDWFPRSPGLYHTTHAHNARFLAQSHHHNLEKIGRHYRPEGKELQIEGGLGSVRFKPFSLGAYDLYLCTATSDCHCHSGIPLGIPSQLLPTLNTNNRFVISGEVKFLPRFLERYFLHNARVPQVYVAVHNIQTYDNNGTAIFITPSVLYKIYNEEDRAFAAYVTCHANENGQIDRAIEWFNDYGHHYHSEIITNFDEQRPAFADVPFSLQKVMNGRLDARNLGNVHIREARIVCDTVNGIISGNTFMSNTNTITIGDGTVIYGDVVAATSIKESFNKASSANISDDLKVYLTKLAEEVGKLNQSLPPDAARQIAQDLSTLTTEATSPTPRKRWWQLAIDSIKQTAQTTAEIGKPVLEILALIVPILAARSG